jgi:hypothetical protein
MEPNPTVDNHTWAGTAGGTLFVIIMQVQATDVFRTAVLAAIGGGVSFSVSLLLKYLVKKFRKH